MSAFALKLEPVEPVGTRRSHAFVNRGHADDGSPINHSYEEIEMPVYPEDAVREGREVREIRLMLGMSLRDMSRRLGISMTQVSELERGAARCDREALISALEIGETSP